MRARCHYCNYSTSVPRTCPTCAAPYLVQTGFGTERVEREVVAAFPGARVARLDRDTIRRRGAAVALLGAVRAGGEIDILVGTQMIAKGHDFPRVTLVGVVSADVGLGLADFRASERTFQLLTQVVGRAGRGEEPGEAIVQTLYPGALQHPARAPPGLPRVLRGGARLPPRDAVPAAAWRSSAASCVREASTRRWPTRAPIVRALREPARAGHFHRARPGAGAVRQAAGRAPRAVLREGHASGRPCATRSGARSTRRPDLRRRVVIDVDPMTVL